MIIKTDKTSFIQECPCGAENVFEYSLPTIRAQQIVLPLCSSCKTRKEFIFISENSSSMDLIVFIKCKEVIKGE